MKRRTAVIAVLLLAVTSFAGCGGDDDDQPGPGAASDAQSDHNDADVEFAQQMVPHHQQAVEMAEMASRNAVSPEVKDLAAAIEGAQDPEIQTMTRWLENWGEPVTPHGGAHGAGMMSEDQMGQLSGASGVAFDHMFLEQMTEHHRGAIRMAETELEDGQFPDALELAERIRDTQQDEVDTMQDLLSRIGER